MVLTKISMTYQNSFSISILFVNSCLNKCFLSLNLRAWIRDPNGSNQRSQGRRKGFGNGGRAKSRAIFLYHTYKKETILFICDFQNPLSHQSISSLFIYTFLYVTIFIFICHYFKLFFFGWQNMGGGAIAPDPLFLRPWIIIKWFKLTQCLIRRHYVRKIVSFP